MYPNLFAGEPNKSGRLSNEAELVKECPKKFLVDKDRRSRNWNMWVWYVLFLFSPHSHRIDVTQNWEWKSDSEEERKRQMRCLFAIRCSFGINPYQRLAILGWMLSEMLLRVPSRRRGWKPKQVPSQFFPMDESK